MQAYVRLFLLLGVTMLVAAGLYFGAEAGWGRLQPVEIALDPGSDQQALFNRIETGLSPQLKKFSGRWLWQVPLDDVLKEIEKDRRVRSVQVRRRFPNRLEVTVAPHRPVLAWVDPMGLIYPVAADASLLPALPSSREVNDVPLIRGRNFKHQPKLREQAIELIKALPDSGPLAAANVSEINYSERDGFGLRLTQGGIEVRFGEGEIGLKASRVERVLNYLNDQQLRGRVIDARFAKKVVVRLRNDP